MDTDLKVVVIPGDAFQRLPDLGFRAFEPLQVDVGATDQGSGD